MIMKPSILTTRYLRETSVLPSTISLRSGRAPKRGFRYPNAIITPIMLWIASHSGYGYAQESANALRIAGGCLATLPMKSLEEQMA